MIGCGHRGEVRGTLLETHSWPFPDVTGAYVNNDSTWDSYGWAPSCTDAFVQDANGEIYCYFNPLVGGIRQVKDGCRIGRVYAPGSWNHVDGRGHYSRDGGHLFEIWTTVFAAEKGYLSGGRIWGGSCSLHGNVAGGTRFQCDAHLFR
jgi:hypothetical protein